MLHLELEDRLGYTKQDPVMKEGGRKPNKLSLVKFSHNIKGCPNYLRVIKEQFFSTTSVESQTFSIYFN